MKLRFSRTDTLLWTAVTLCTAAIYATLPAVPLLRKWLAETYGPGVYDTVSWTLAAVGAAVAFVLIRTVKGVDLLRGLAGLAVIAAVYGYYLRSMAYAVERVHFLEYGVLGWLVFAALRRHLPGWNAALLTVNVVYWIGLGDETIQRLLPGRVAEIRDCVTNLVSGALGMAVPAVVFGQRFSPGISRRNLRSLVAALGVTTVATAAFLAGAQGFGHVVESKDPGRIFSSFTAAELAGINGGTVTPDARRARIYDNEAARHLLQREFCLTTDFKGRDGTIYRRHDLAAFENRVLEVHYARFLARHAADSASILLRALDREVAAHTVNPVRWPDFLRQQIDSAANPAASPEILESRVKSTIIRSFGAGDLGFYTVLILLVLAVAWLRVPAALHRR